jgi:4-diphosphocytidyl-2-C-methyl-D-erythritol kinase
LSAMRAFLSYAKFNLYLAVLGRRPDGYHEIDSVLQSVSLADRLTFTPLEDPRLELHCDAPGIPTGAGNLIVRALERLRSRGGVRAGMRVVLEKRIPAMAGLGGGSSNAACALAAGNLVWSTGLPEEALAELGSDVPFFLRGGAQRCRGRGERLDPLTPIPASDWILVKPPWGHATRDVYALTAKELTGERPDVRIMLESIAKRDLPGIVGLGFNDLEGPAREITPQADDLRRRLAAAGLQGVRQAGSGSAWVGWCPDPVAARRVRSEGRRRGWAVYRVRPTERGWIEAQSGPPGLSGK